MSPEDAVRVAAGIAQNGYYEQFGPFCMAVGATPSRNAANATCALNAGAWLRRFRLVMVLLLQVLGCRGSQFQGQNHTDQTVQFSGTGSEVGGFQGFAASLRQDYDAVHAALSEPWSTGPVDGHINKLKVIKRDMYGRAGFDLLRSRVLAAA